MKRIYPWEQWFARPRCLITYGIDYQCAQSSMTQMIRNNASKRGLRVRLTDCGTEIMIEVVAPRSNADAVPRTDRAAVVAQ